MDRNVTRDNVCTNCGTPADAGLIFCKKCDATLRPPVPLVSPAPQSPYAHVSVFADGIALLLIAVQLALLFWWLVPDDGSRFITGMLAYGVLVANLTVAGSFRLGS